MMKVSIFGLGYVGAVSTACLARDGNTVVGVDIDESKLEMFRSGISPIVEEGMPELVRDVVANKEVAVTSDIYRAIHDTELSFICVGTPSRPNGSQDLSAAQRVCEQIGQALRDKTSYHVVVVRSTVVPGTVEEVLTPILKAESGKRNGVEFDVCFMPEFLREGTSIRDYDNPPYTVVGSSSEKAAQAIQKLFANLESEFCRTNVRTAEMLKYASNAFHATKITFANEVGRLCKAYDVDSHEVMELFSRDTALNISAAYLKPGFAFGGSCLPKDLRAVLHMAKTRDVELPMLQAIVPSNTTHIHTAIDSVLSNGRRTIGMIGLSFKSGTDDLRESPLVALAEHFIGKGLTLSIYDREVNLSRIMGANKKFIETSIPHIAQLMTSDCRQMIRDSEVIVVGIKDPEIVDLLHEEARAEHFVLDLVHIPEHDTLDCKYRGVCW
jgi:GDP-mannose 6-dehydrogenase